MPNFRYKIGDRVTVTPDHYSIALKEKTGTVLDIYHDAGYTMYYIEFDSPIIGKRSVRAHYLRKATLAEPSPNKLTRLLG